MTRDIEVILARVADELSSARDAIRENLSRYVGTLIGDDTPPAGQEEPAPVG